MSNSKSAAAAREGKRSQGDNFRGGYAAGKVSSGSSLKPPPSSVTKVKSSSK